ncbi:MAG TPA: RHS repeat-associated core domain-containing protein, partial [Acidimicrobiales bacterium]|nr:RHS repeat-associated core domain-containing protein [Acidimicrobiales bacterium]
GFGGTWSDAWSIDDAGTVYGNATFTDTPMQDLSNPIHLGHAYTFDDTIGLRDLNTLVDQVTSPGWTLFTALGGAGDYIFGDGRLDGADLAYRLDKVTGEVIELGSVGTGVMLLDSVNRFADAVGTAWKQPGFVDPTGWAYVQGQFHDLNDVIDPASGWHITSADGINDQGDVVGQGTFDGVPTAYRIRLPLRTAGAAGPALAEIHTYGYDGLRTSTSTGNDPMHMQTQYWFTQDYTQTVTGNREHYVRIGDRIVAKVTMNPDGNGAFVPPLSVNRDEENADGPGASRKALALFLLGLGLAGALFGMRSRRKGWVPATAGVLALVVVATSCGMLGVPQKVASAWSLDGSGPHYFHHGVAPGPIVITGGGAVLEERRYEPFGQPIDEKGPGGVTSVNFATEPQNILGKFTDANSGWSYHGARWMAPQTARWLTPDPWTKIPDPIFLLSPWSTNPYQFVEQRPTEMWDPNGRNSVMFGSVSDNLATHQHMTAKALRPEVTSHVLDAINKGVVAEDKTENQVRTKEAAAKHGMRIEGESPEEAIALNKAEI